MRPHGACRQTVGLYGSRRPFFAARETTRVATNRCRNTSYHMSCRYPCVRPLARDPACPSGLCFLMCRVFSIVVFTGVPEPCDVRVVYLMLTASDADRFAPVDAQAPAQLTDRRDPDTADR